MEVIINGVVYVPKEKKLELDLLEEKYKSGEYIGICKGVDGEWILSNVFVNGFYPKLIHKKHKNILDAYLADNSVEIECKSDNETYWTDNNFIKDYRENLEYRLKQQYPIFKRSVNGIFKQTSEYDCEWVFHKNSYAVGNEFREYTGRDIVETIPYDKERGLYHLQPVWCWGNNWIGGRNIRFYSAETKKCIDVNNIKSAGNYDNIEPITPEQLKVVPFVWDMYQQILKDKQ